MDKEIYKESPDQPDTAATWNNLGNAWNNLGNMEEAVRCLECALAMYQRFHKSSDHLDIAKTLRNLGNVYSHLGEVNKAVTYLKRALEMYQRCDHQPSVRSDIARTLKDLGNACRDLKDAHQAIDYYERAVQILTKLYAANHPYVVGTLHNLGCMYHVKALVDRQKGDESLAKGYLEKATTSFKQAIDAISVVEGGLYTEYSNFLLNTGKAPLVDNYLHQAYDHLSKVIENGNNAEGLNYSLLEKETVPSSLQTYISQQTKVSLRAIDYAYYLMIHHYEDFQQAGITMTQSKEDYLAAYQASIDQRSGQPKPMQKTRPRPPTTC